MTIRQSIPGLLLCLTAIALQAQAPAPIERHPPSGQPTQTITVESRLVDVALNVVDEAGAPVGGLTVDDFELTEDGKPQKIAIFEKESATPLSIVIAMDASESVLSDRGLERDAARKFLRGLVRPQDRVDLMAFSDAVDEIVPFTNDVHAVESGIGRIERGSSTALYDAIYLASQRLAQAPRVPNERRVVVLITDGENTASHGTYPAALEQAQRAGAMIYSLIIVPVAADAGRNEGGEHALIQMAHDTGGKYYYVEDKHDLQPAFAHVSEDLRTQYTIGYYAPQKGVDSSGLRQIGLQLKDPALRARYT
ncbi:MAG TPA: VWA domain-containing protein, partial [Acidobacteriaceae bacterium]|nr:VWA domain-containing protein [Acidobacteriaceae bacterium]